MDIHWNYIYLLEIKLYYYPKFTPLPFIKANQPQVHFSNVFGSMRLFLHVDKYLWRTKNITASYKQKINLFHAINDF